MPDFVAYARPDRVVSKAKLRPWATCSSISASMIRPALIAATSGAKGEGPAAIRSALTNTGHRAYIGRNSRANVVLPAPLGPAMMMARGRILVVDWLVTGDFAVALSKGWVSWSGRFRQHKGAQGAFVCMGLTCPSCPSTPPPD